MRTFDIGRVLTLDELKQLRGAGFEAAALYLDPFNAKGCNPQFLRDIYAAGLKLAGFFYETTGGAGQGESYFTRTQGAFDAGQSEHILADFSAAGLVPPGVIVWYAADVNIDPPAFDEYANGIEHRAGALQTPGVYGYQRLCEHARANYPHMGQHLAQTYGTVTGSLDLWQHEQVTIEGITVDEDECWLPGWRPEEDDMDEAAVKRLVREVLMEDGYPNFVHDASARLAIDAHHGHHVTMSINNTPLWLNCSEPVANPST